MKGTGRRSFALLRFFVAVCLILPVQPATTCFAAPAADRYSYFEDLPLFNPLTPLEPDEMRITFMGSMIPLPVRLAQAEMSVFVEVGWVPDPSDSYYHGKPADQFIFDMGAGTSANYAAAKVGYRRMDKIFINHLHADHMNDLIHTYCFGPSSDRKSPLYVWGSKPSGVEDPAGSAGGFGSGGCNTVASAARPLYHDDGVKAFCSHIREATRWHTESFSFQGTRYAGYEPPTKSDWGLPHDPVPVGTDDPRDAYALVPIELDWEKVGGVAYDNGATGVKITHFPVIHCRKGAMGYKLEWTREGNTLSMIYTSDTKPEVNSVEQAKNNGAGVDVFIHEMVVPPSVWAYKSMGLDRAPLPGEPGYADFQRTVAGLTRIQNSSHTSQGAFGHILSRIDPHPRLTVATHFPVADDTVESAFNSVRNHCDWVVMNKDNGNFVFSFDLMVLRVFPDRIIQCRADASRFAFNPPARVPEGMLTPKYHDSDGAGDPYAQIDISAEIPAKNPDGTENYREDGF